MVKDQAFRPCLAVCRRALKRKSALAQRHSHILLQIAVDFVRYHVRVKHRVGLRPPHRAGHIRLARVLSLQIHEEDLQLVGGVAPRPAQAVGEVPCGHGLGDRLGRSAGGLILPAAVRIGEALGIRRLDDGRAVVDLARGVAALVLRRSARKIPLDGVLVAAVVELHGHALGHGNAFRGDLRFHAAGKGIGGTDKGEALLARRERAERKAAAHHAGDRPLACRHAHILSIQVHLVAQDLIIDLACPPAGIQRQRLRGHDRRGRGLARRLGVPPRKGVAVVHGLARADGLADLEGHLCGRGRTAVAMEGHGVGVTVVVQPEHERAVRRDGAAGRRLLRVEMEVRIALFRRRDRLAGHAGERSGVRLRIAVVVRVLLVIFNPVRRRRACRPLGVERHVVRGHPHAVAHRRGIRLIRVPAGKGVARLFQRGREDHGIVGHHIAALRRIAAARRRAAVEHPCQRIGYALIIEVDVRKPARGDRVGLLYRAVDPRFTVGDAALDKHRVACKGVERHRLLRPDALMLGLHRVVAVAVGSAHVVAHGHRLRARLPVRGDGQVMRGHGQALLRAPAQSVARLRHSREDKRRAVENAALCVIVIFHRAAVEIPRQGMRHAVIVEVNGSARCGNGIARLHRAVHPRLAVFDAVRNQQSAVHKLRKRQHIVCADVGLLLGFRDLIAAAVGLEHVVAHGHALAERRPLGVEGRIPVGHDPRGKRLRQRRVGEPAVEAVALSDRRRQDDLHAEALRNIRGIAAAVAHKVQRDRHAVIIQLHDRPAVPADGVRARGLVDLCAVDLRAHERQSVAGARQSADGQALVRFTGLAHDVVLAVKEQISAAVCALGVVFHAVGCVGARRPGRVEAQRLRDLQSAALIKRQVLIAREVIAAERQPGRIDCALIPDAVDHVAALQPRHVVSERDRIELAVVVDLGHRAAVRHDRGLLDLLELEACVALLCRRGHALGRAEKRLGVFRGQLIAAGDRLLIVLDGVLGVVARGPLRVDRNALVPVVAVRIVVRHGGREVERCRAASVRVPAGEVIALPGRIHGLTDRRARAQGQGRHQTAAARIKGDVARLGRIAPIDVDRAADRSVGERQRGVLP